MHPSIRRLGTAAGVLALAAGAAVAPAANATTTADPASCLRLLVAGFDAGATIVAPRTPLIAETGPLVNRTCYSFRVSLAISKTDLTGTRTKLAARSGYEQRAYIFRATFSSLPGTWMIRQIAVGDASGRIAIKQFTTTRNPVRAISESRLTGKPTGDIRLDPGRGGFFLGYLKAYSRFGTWTNLAPGQRIQLQARPHGSSRGYATVANTTTSASGYWQVAWKVPAGRWDVRVAYVTPYRSVASDFTWLGVVR